MNNDLLRLLAEQNFKCMYLLNAMVLIQLAIQVGKVYYWHGQFFMLVAVVLFILAFWPRHAL